MTAITLTGSPLTIDEVVAVARHHAPVALGEDAHARITNARAAVDAAIDSPDAIYGVNTGFGSLSRVRIDASDLREVQRNLIRSHAAGVGEPLPDDVVRAMMLLLAASLSRGCSGVRIDLVAQLIACLNAGITPVIPGRGSVGASGDLAPLAHLALVLIGEGEATVNGTRMDGGAALAAADLTPVTLQAKEGLALINGTHFMAAMGALVAADTAVLFDAAVRAAALAIDACRATDAFLDARIHQVRRQPGQATVAALLRAQLKESEIITSHRDDDPRVQDPYSLRATPQVLGAASDSIAHVRSVVERELGAVTDNPLVFPDGGAILSGANFHGMPLAIALDMVPIALAHIAGIAERRVFWLLAASDSENPVNVYLSPQPGLHSGLMIAQYTAAACCNEIQTLATPASVANIPTSAGIEDYNSMGATSAHQARAALELALNVAAIELIVMAEALEYHRPLRSGASVERTHELVRSVVPRLTEDRPPAPDIAAVVALIRTGAFVE